MLKKLLSLTCLSLAFTIPSFAQISTSTNESDSTTASNFRPHGGDVTVEAGINFFDDNNTVTLGQLRTRVFFSSKTAFRLGLNIDNTTDQSSASRNIERSYKLLSIAPGIEKHLKGTERLSPYMGLEFVWTKTSSKDKTHSYTVDNGWLNEQNRAYNSFGANALLGADFYIAKNFYVGIEVGLGFTNYDYDDMIIRQYNTNQPNPGITTTVLDGYESSSFGTRVKNGIRIGYVF